MNPQTLFASIEKRFQERFAWRAHVNEGCGICNEAFLGGDKPLIAAAQGCMLHTDGGLSLIDLSMGGGVVLLGHAHPVLAEAAARALQTGTVVISPNQAAVRLAELLSNILPPAMQGTAFCSSGTEATLRLCRLARAFTGRSKLAMFAGGWHGTHDYVLFAEDYQHSHDTAAIPISSGLPSAILGDTILLPYNSDRAFEIIRRHKNELALVLIEPVQGSNPRDDIAEFLKDLRKTCTEFDVLLGFDEIITGFRLGLGGAQEKFGIDADIAAYGKVIGAGFPVGIVRGRSDIMRLVGREVYFGGTFSANPFVMTASSALVEYLTANRDTVYPHLDAVGARLQQSVNKYCLRENIPARISGIGSFLRLLFTDKFVGSRRDRDHLEISQVVQRAFYHELLNRGILVGSNRILYLSAAHDQRTVDQVADTMIAVLGEFKASGCFADPPASVEIPPNDKQL